MVRGQYGIGYRAGQLAANKLLKSLHHENDILFTK